MHGSYFHIPDIPLFIPSTPCLLSLIYEALREVYRSFLRSLRSWL
jgi:hypothetical protein